MAINNSNSGRLLGMDIVTDTSIPADTVILVARLESISGESVDEYIERVAKASVMITGIGRSDE